MTIKLFKKFRNERGTMVIEKLKDLEVDFTHVPRVGEHLEIENNEYRVTHITHKADPYNVLIYGEYQQPIKMVKE